MIGRLRLTGFVAWLLWLGVHLLYLTGFKNRVTALLHWGVSFVGRGRSERTATEQQIFGREALTRLEGGAAGLVSNGEGLQGPDPAIAAKRRQELEEQALAEIRLTDSGERGQPVR
jgi:NADH dehydrogenase